VNYLALCKFAHRYIGAGDDLPGTAPTTTVAQTGFLYEITQWVNDAYSDIQQEQQYWNWKRSRTFSLALSNGVATYSRATIQVQLPTWDYIIPMVDRSGTPYVLVHRTSVGFSDQTLCFFIPYQDWRGYKDRGTIPSGKPVYYTELPDKSLSFYPTPDAAYTVTTDYRKVLDVLSGDSDTPEMPDQYHEAIAWGAAALWALQRESANKYAAFRDKRDEIMDKMRVDELPVLEWDVTLFYNR